MTRLQREAMPTEQSNRSTNTQTGEQKSSTATLTPELVKEVADKVYAMMLRDLKITQERHRGSSNAFHRKGGKV